MLSGKSALSLCQQSSSVTHAHDPSETCSRIYGISLPSISLASIAIGFISFTFTLLIWLHTYWSAFLTIGSAPSQIQDALSTLRQSLYEEREYLKRKRRRGDAHYVADGDRKKGDKGGNLYYEGGPTKIINDAVKDLIRDFKRYETPFLESPHTGREKELEWSFDATQQYYRCDFGHRILWLRSKGGIEDIADRLQKIQTRRVAVEVTEMSFLVKDLMGMVRNVEDRVGRVEERLRMSRIE